nr:hypothetical protein OH837_49075 [Streptomyces canus]
MAPTRPLNAAVKAEVAAELNGLPHGRITAIGNTAHVSTNGLPELESWFLALGGHIRCDPAPTGEGVVIWTLTTNTDHGHGAPVLVQTFAKDTDQLDPDCADAVRRTGEHRAGRGVQQ